MKNIECKNIQMQKKNETKWKASRLEAAWNTNKYNKTKMQKHKMQKESFSVGDSSWSPNALRCRSQSATLQCIVSLSKFLIQKIANAKKCIKIAQAYNVNNCVAGRSLQLLIQLLNSNTKMQKYKIQKMWK